MSDDDTEIIRIDASRMGEKIRTLMKVAVDLGWYAKQQRDNGVMLVAPEPHAAKVIIHIPPIRSVSDKRLNSWYATIRTYSDQKDMASFMAIGKSGFDTNLARYPNSSDDNSTIDVKVVRKKSARPEPHIVHERAWIAKRSVGPKGAMGYDSHAVIERKWSDHSVDYACSHPGCGYTNAAPVPVARHYGSSRDHEPRDTPEVKIKIPIYEPGSRNADRVSRLAAEIQRALDKMAELLQGGDADITAQTLAEYMIEARNDKGEVHDRDGEPLTAEQLVERIRTLVDDGSYYQRIEQERDQKILLDEQKRVIDRLNEQLGELAKASKEMDGRMTAAEAKVVAAEADARKYKTNWETLKSMVNEEG